MWLCAYLSSPGLGTGTSMRWCQSCVGSSVARCTAAEEEEEEAEEQGAGGGRRAGSGAGWREIFLDAAEAAWCDGVMRAVLAGHSVLVLEAVASTEECAALVAEAGGLARRELEARDTIVT